MLKRRYEFKAEFFDADPMGVMWHGNYVKYLEMARCRLLDELNFNYIKMQNRGFALPIIKMDLKYINPIYFNDDFIVEIRLVECDITLKFNYILLSKDNQIIAKASTTQVAVTLNKETLYAIPDELKFALNQ
ncbi:acyl-CoA thioesterase [uncultured Campylobacter sp.]|jgi:acyl-CoA thioester hydrolase|uniref:acyl-CoA thioesterase n=1 Tax=uncultured Campylobacter sp. TaxID=218934 RepID=UPI002607C0D2|nr:acyl-CoA thioesterase [uncultured Campylobacter sp.]